MGKEVPDYKIKKHEEPRREKLRGHFKDTEASDDAIDLLFMLLRYEPMARIWPERGMVHQYCKQFHDEGSDITWQGHRIPNGFDDNTKLKTVQYRDEIYKQIKEADAAAADRQRG